MCIGVLEWNGFMCESGVELCAIVVCECELEC